MKNPALKNLLNVLLFVAMLVAACVATVRHGALAGLAVASIGTAAVHTLFHREAMPQLFTATLILPILTGKIIPAFKQKVPALSYFSTDWGKAGSAFASPVKWQQEVISQLASVPAVSDHVPGDDLTSGALNAKNLVTDVRVRIDRAKRVVIKLPTADAVSLMMDGAFMQTLIESGIALGRQVVADGLAEVTPDNFTLSMVETKANHDLDTLKTARIALNAVGAGEPRYGIAGSTAVGNIGTDTRVSSNQFYNQRQGVDAYQRLVNIEGFTEVAEAPSFPSGNPSVGVVTAATTDVITKVAHGLLAGDRVRFTTTNTLPAGLTVDTNYYVIASGLTADAFKVSATLSGSAVDITDTGTGVHTALVWGALNGFYFEKRAIHIASRQLIDNLEMARALGIPVPIASHQETDPETGLTFSAFMWIDVKTHDIYVAFVVAYGIKAGRALGAGVDVDAGTLAAGTGMDYAGIRVIEA